MNKNEYDLSVALDFYKIPYSYSLINTVEFDEKFKDFIVFLPQPTTVQVFDKNSRKPTKNFLMLRPIYL
jgi:hypothetical protein